MRKLLHFVFAYSNSIDNALNNINKNRKLLNYISFFTQIKIVKWKYILRSSDNENIKQSSEEKWIIEITKYCVDDLVDM